MRFFARQILDALSPSNYLATNPQVIRRAMETGGDSVATGLRNLLNDLGKGRISMTDEQAFEVGRNLAITPGSVVFENELFQLIQYRLLTETVGARPLILILPSINKFYVFDLQPRTGLLRRRHDARLHGFRDGSPQRGQDRKPNVSHDHARLHAGRRDRLTDRRAECGGARANDRRRRHPAGTRACFCVLHAARKRSHLALRGRQLSRRPPAGRVRHSLLECRQHESARPHVLLVCAQHLPGEQSPDPRTNDSMRHRGRPQGDRRAHLCTGKSRGSHRAVADRLSDHAAGSR